MVAERFFALASADYGRPPARLDAAARAKLLAHHWPGNVRELGNVMERVALLSDAPIITADVLALDPGPAPSTAPPAALSASTSFSVGCYCEDASQCHRSLLAKLLREAGAEVRPWSS